MLISLPDEQRYYYETYFANQIWGVGSPPVEVSESTAESPIEVVEVAKMPPGPPIETVEVAETPAELSIETIIANIIGVDERVDRSKDEIKIRNRPLVSINFTPLVRMNTARTDACALVSRLFLHSARSLDDYNTLESTYPALQEEPKFVHNKEIITAIFNDYLSVQNLLNHNQYHEIVALRSEIEHRIAILQLPESTMQGFAFPA